MALVCSCLAVSERKVVKAIAHGASSVDEIGERCGAGTCCGGCHPSLEALLRTHVQTRPDPAGSGPFSPALA
jgi:bacterioferritin-associated ferredoxin